MNKLHTALPREYFWPLPAHSAASQAPRRVGLEIEFAEVSVDDAAELVRALWGGEICAQGPRDIQVKGGQFGDVKIELDIALKTKWAEDIAAKALGDLVPVEIVTPPLAQSDLRHAEHLTSALRKAGAKGSRAALAYSFGLHLNPELPTPDGSGLVAVARAYALLEDWLRASDPIDPARNIMPFVDRWPNALVEALVAGENWSVDDLAIAYARHAPSRQYGLDLLPALEHLRPELLTDVPDTQLKGGRPTFHYRLADARVDEPGWSIAYEWNRWVLVERVATTPDVLDALASDWTGHHASLTSTRGNWVAQVESRLERYYDLLRD
ncbi:MAG: amidoligase family protein [Rhodobacteraceae bacterium]|nr:amidoligase family protein [Paracoccaceae bacterium]